MERGAIALGMVMAMGLAGSGDALAGMTIQKVSVSSAGSEGNGWSGEASISGDGRYVAFNSAATNLVDGDTNGLYDIFVRDLQTGTTERVNLDAAGNQATGAQSYQPALSWDGRYVAFHSAATNLVPDDADFINDIVVRDRTTGTNELASVNTDEIKGDGDSGYPSLSGDGRYVAFHSNASNLAQDAGPQTDVFVRDRTAGTTELISVTPDGTAGGNNPSSIPSISQDGRYVAFASLASNLHPGDPDTTSDIFVRDRTSGTTELMSVNTGGLKGNGSSAYPVISADGRYVAFESSATNLVPEDTNNHNDLFVRDRQENTTERVSVGPAGEQAVWGTEGYGGGISSDGRYVVFSSNSDNLVANDTNTRSDVFRRDRTTPANLRVNLSSTGSEMTDGWFSGNSSPPVISGNGIVMAFSTDSTTLLVGDTYDFYHVYVVTMDHYTLNVTLAGSGTGSVSSSPAGIDCGIDCGEVYEGGTGVVLTSTPDAGSKFRGWSGNPDCADGAVTMNTDITCTATFTSFPWIMFNNILTGRGKK